MNFNIDHKHSLGFVRALFLEFTKFSESVKKLLIVK